MPLESDAPGDDIVDSRNAIPIRLTGERWTHLTNRHPELMHQRACVRETIAGPDLIQQTLASYSRHAGIRVHR